MRDERNKREKRKSKIRPGILDSYISFMRILYSYVSFMRMKVDLGTMERLLYDLID